MKKRQKYLWVVRKIYTDGSEKNIELNGEKYSLNERERIISQIKEMFPKEPSLMSSYAFFVETFPFGRYGISSQDRIIYLNRAGLLF